MKKHIILASLSTIISFYLIYQVTNMDCLSYCYTSEPCLIAQKTLIIFIIACLLTAIYNIIQLIKELKRR